MIIDNTVIYWVGIVLNVILIPLCYKKGAIKSDGPALFLVLFIGSLSLAGTFMFSLLLAMKKWPKLAEAMAPQQTLMQRRMADRVRLRGALRQLVDDMVNAQEEKSLWSSAAYDSLANAAKVLEETK